MSKLTGIECQWCNSPTALNQDRKTCDHCAKLYSNIRNYPSIVIRMLEDMHRSKIKFED